MGQIVAQMTTSLDGYYVGPNDGPGRGLGEGGERLHYWVFAGPWSYGQPSTGEATGVDKQLLNDAFQRVGAVIAGRGTYEALARACEAAGPGDVSIMGGDVIRQVLASGRLNELVVSIAPVLPGAGKRLFEGAPEAADLERVDVVQSPWVTHLRYRVVAG